MTVRVVVTAAPLGVTLAGEKMQPISAGNPEQSNVTAWLKPLLGVTVRVDLPEDPAAMVRAVGLAEIEKSAADAVAVPESATV